MQEDKDPYSGYDLDDWQWEFLRRNSRYIKARKAIEWLKKRLDKNTPRFQNGSFKAFGVSCHFSRVYAAQSSVWRYDEKWIGHEGSFTSEWYLDLPDPSASSGEYKAKILRMRKPRAVVKLGEWSEQDETNWDIRPPFEEYKLTVLIDARYDTDRILSELKEILKHYRPNTRSQMRLYESYLAVWDLRNEGLTDTQIAEELWPEDYETIGGRDDIGNKGSLMQRVHDHDKAAQKLIDNSFPRERRSFKVKK